MARLRVNYPCLIGVAIGLIAVMGQWAHVPLILGQFIGQYGHVYHDLLMQLDLLVMTSPMLFIIGTLVAIVTPLGGVIQVIGIIEYVSTLMAVGYYEGFFLFEPTMFMAIGVMSAMVTIYSLRWPKWISRDDGTFPGSKDKERLLSRLLTFSLMKEEMPSELPSPDESV